LSFGEKRMQHTKVCVPELYIIDIRNSIHVKNSAYRFGLFVQVNDFPEKDVDKDTKIIRVEVF
jgi:hypothetical protein